MVIRQAELKDHKALVGLLTGLTTKLIEYGQWMYAKDPDEFEGGINTYVSFKLYDQNALVLISEDKNGKPDGFLIGDIEYHPPFFEHRVVAVIRFASPLGWNLSRMSKAFAEWAKARGATAGSNYALPGYDKSHKIFERDGRRLGFYLYYKPFNEVKR